MQTLLPDRRHPGAAEVIGRAFEYTSGPRADRLGVRAAPCAVAAMARQAGAPVRGLAGPRARARICRTSTSRIAGLVAPRTTRGVADAAASDDLGQGKDDCQHVHDVERAAHQ